jgi:hypothetical protein
LTGKPHEKKLLSKTRPRQGNNIKTDLREISYENVNWITVVENRTKIGVFAKTVTKFRVV